MTEFEVDISAALQSKFLTVSSMLLLMMTQPFSSHIILLSWLYHRGMGVVSPLFLYFH